MATQIEIQNNIHLERILFKNPDFEQYMRTAVGYVLEQARKDVVSAAKQALDTDPHGAARAVRRIVYKQILGGNLNILRKKRAGKMGSVPASSRGRLASTERMMGYRGADRGFILRFVNAGTANRVAKHMDGHSIMRNEKVKWHEYKSGKIGGRGAIAGKDFFGHAAQSAIQEASQLLQVELDRIIKKQIQ